MKDRGLHRRGTPGHRLQNQFFLTALGASKADDLTITDRLDWYPKQAKFVALVAGRDSGTRLKQRQYKQDSYAEAVWGTEIGSIRDQAESRLAALRATALSPTAATGIPSKREDAP